MNSSNLLGKNVNYQSIKNSKQKKSKYSISINSNPSNINVPFMNNPKKEGVSSQYKITSEKIQNLNFIKKPQNFKMSISSIMNMLHHPNNSINKKINQTLQLKEYPIKIANLNEKNDSKSRKNHSIHKNKNSYSKTRKSLNQQICKMQVEHFLNIEKKIKLLKNKKINELKNLDNSPKNFHKKNSFCKSMNLNINFINNNNNYSKNNKTFVNYNSNNIIQEINSIPSCEINKNHNHFDSLNHFNNNCNFLYNISDNYNNFKISNIIYTNNNIKKLLSKSTRNNNLKIQNNSFLKIKMRITHGKAKSYSSRDGIVTIFKNNSKLFKNLENLKNNHHNHILSKNSKDRNNTKKINNIENNNNKNNNNNETIKNSNNFVNLNTNNNNIKNLKQNSHNISKITTESYNYKNYKSNYSSNNIVFNNINNQKNRSKSRKENISLNKNGNMSINKIMQIKMKNLIPFSKKSCNYKFIQNHIKKKNNRQSNKPNEISSISKQKTTDITPHNTIKKESFTGGSFNHILSSEENSLFNYSSEFDEENNDNFDDINSIVRKMDFNDINVNAKNFFCEDNNKEYEKYKSQFYKKFTLFANEKKINSY